jgi:hypothetical protein
MQERKGSAGSSKPKQTARALGCSLRGEAITWPALWHRLFRRNARVGSGSAMDAFRFEQRTGILLSPSGHGLKLFERRSQLQRLRRELSLFPADRQVVKELLIDIQNALSGQ